jgi:branched-chain amino acid transport system ATP-binding protein
LARALACRPRLLLLDEIMAGLNAREVGEIMEVIENVNRSKVTIVMIEHIMKAVMGVSHRVLVLNHGRRIALGSPEEIAEDKLVIQSYLGKRYMRE